MGVVYVTAYKIPLPQNRLTLPFRFTETTKTTVTRGYTSPRDGSSSSRRKGKVIAAVSGVPAEAVKFHTSMDGTAAL